MLLLTILVAIDMVDCSLFITVTTIVEFLIKWKTSQSSSLSW